MKIVLFLWMDNDSDFKTKMSSTIQFIETNNVVTYIFFKGKNVFAP